MISNIRSTRSSSTGFFVLTGLLIIAPLFLLAFLTQKHYQKQQNHLSQSNNRTTIEPSNPFLWMEKVNLLHINIKKNYEIKAQAARIHLMKNTAQIIGSDIEAVITEKKNNTTHIAAQSGIFAQDDKKIYLEKNVKIMYENIEIVGQKLVYDLEQKIVESRSLFMLKNNTLTLRANEGSINVETGEASLEGAIQTIIEAHGTQPQR